MISNDDLARIREAVAATMTESVSIQRRSSTPDGMGGRTDAWVEAATIPARFDHVGSTPGEREVVQAMAEKWRDRPILRMLAPHDADISVGDRVVRGDDIWEVIALLPESTWKVETVALVAK